MHEEFGEPLDDPEEGRGIAGPLANVQDAEAKLEHATLPPCVRG
jgi:hypothetical protein